MEWVETTAKTLEQAKETALEQLGIGPDDAEFEVLTEPRPGLFGRLRGEARVRARVRPATVRPKYDRRNRRRERGERGAKGNPTASKGSAAPTATEESAERAASDEAVTTNGDAAAAGRGRSSSSGRSGRRRGRRGGDRSGSASANELSSQGATHASSAGETVAMSDDTMSSEPPTDAAHTRAESTPDVAAVQRAAEEFATGLIDAFGVDGSVTAVSEGTEIDVQISGAEGSEGLGLLIGPGGRTLLAIQDLARVAAQRRLGDHDTRLRVDVAGYREKRRVALERFASHVADLVKESGIARSLDPMPSSDRKVVHDALAQIDGVSSRSEGEDPDRRIIVTPAEIPADED